MPHHHSGPSEQYKTHSKEAKAKTKDRQSLV